MATVATATATTNTKAMAMVTATSSQVQDNRHGLSQTVAASTRQNNDLKLPLLLRFEEGEGGDRQKRREDGIVTKEHNTKY